MTDEYIITKEEIERFGDYVEDDDNRSEEKYKNARHLAAMIRAHKLSDELTDAYRNGFIDGQSKAAIENDRNNKARETAAKQEVLDQLFAWAYNERNRYEIELRRISRAAPHLHDKPLCLATDASMCGLFMDKIESMTEEESNDHPSV